MKNLRNVLGVGPAYVGSSFVITLTCIYLDKKILLSSEASDLASVLFYLTGVSSILLGAYLWSQSVISSKITKNVINSKLITTGIYSYVRNPLYSGFMFIFTGIIILLNNYFLLVAPFILWILLTIIIQKEERDLENLFGSHYIEYKQKVNRCIPSIQKKERR